MDCEIPRFDVSGREPCCINGLPDNCPDEKRFRATPIIIPAPLQTTMSVSSEERYSRQLLFRPIGAEGQRRLLEASVAIVGCGATGSALATLLARAGVGRIRIIDRDYVEPSNLQRQLLFDESDAAESLPKAVAAVRKINSFNTGIEVESRVADLTPANTEELLTGAQLVLDGTDNF